LAVNIYLTHKSAPALGRGDVEKVVLDAAMGFYDNASNCGRSRGGIKKASDTLVALTSLTKIKSQLVCTLC
jgi:hypothetical protein